MLRREREKGSSGRRRTSFTLVTGEKQGKGGRSRRADKISAGQMESFYMMASHFSMKHKTGPPARIGVEASRGFEIVSVTCGLVGTIH